MRDLLKNISINPWQYLVLSFALLISFGTVLLSMPFIKHTGDFTKIDALFTSTSAVCVTGLTTVNTSGFNLAGQISILVLIQLGAIGIMTLTSSFLLALKGTVSLKHRISFSKLQENYELQDANSILKNILKITFVSELIGMILLSLGFTLEGLPIRESLYQGLFHSVSAFCNAGFSTYDTSLTGMNPLIKYTVSMLIIIGGLGYFVIYEIMEKYKNKRKLSLHSKIVIYTSLLLIFGGSMMIFIFENGNISILDSFFQSVTTRTAGFNTIDLTKLSYASIFTLIVLMFIGASPGSTGGGIKTTTFFVIIYSIVAVLKGKTHIVIFNRSIPSKFILKAFATTIIYFVIISIGVIILLQNHDFKLEEILFESVSAMGTVGLTLGVTTHLSNIGKIIIVLLMFTGRLGPASFAMMTMIKAKQLKVKYPEGEIY